MIYPNNFEQKIGFDVIRQSLKELCDSPLGVAFVDKVKFSSNAILLTKLLEQTEEFRQILILANNFPSEHYYDVTDELNNIAVQGTYIQ